MTAARDYGASISRARALAHGWRVSARELREMQESAEDFVVGRLDEVDDIVRRARAGDTVGAYPLGELEGPTW